MRRAGERQETREAETGWWKIGQLGAGQYAQRQCQALSVLFLVFLGGCGAHEDPSPALPNPPVNVQIVLTNYEYRALRLDGGAVYVPGGSRGLLVYRDNASTYRAFERLCPYQPQTHCAKMSLDNSRLFLRDSCCGTQWDFEGNATGGPGVRPLQQYATSLVGGTLYITN